MHISVPIVIAVSGIAVGLLFVAGTADAATTVNGGTISVDTTWTTAGSPYVVNGHVTIAGASNPVLTIEPGVEVRFNTDGWLLLGSGSTPGSLRANGTEASPITFTSNLATPARGDWRNIRFQGPAATTHTSYVQNATVSWGGRQGYSVIDVINQRVELRDVTVQDLNHWGLYVNNAQPIVDAFTVQRSSQGGVYVETNARPVLSDVVVRDVALAPIRARVDQDLSGLSVANASRRLELWGVDTWLNFTLSQMADLDDGSPYHPNIVSSGWRQRGGTVVTVAPGTTVLFNDGTWIDLGTCCSVSERGGFVAEGTEAAPIVLRSTSNSTTNGWYGMYFYGGYASVESVLRNVTIAQSRDDGIEAYNYPTLTLDNVTLLNHARWGVDLRTNTHARIRNLVIDQTGSDGFRVWDASPTVDGLRVSRAGASGLYLGYSSSGLRDVTVERSTGAGVYTSGCGLPTLVDATIDGANGYAIYADGTCNGVHLDNVHVEDVAGRVMRNRIDARDAFTFSNVSTTDHEYWGADLYANRTLRVDHHEDGRKFTSTILSGFTVRNRATLTIPANATVRMNEYIELQVGVCCTNQGGSLVAEGTAEQPIRFTGLYGTPSRGWYGLHIYGYNDPRPSVLRNVTVEHSRDDAIEVAYNPQVTFDNLTARNNTQRGVYLREGSHVVGKGLLLENNGWEGLTMYSSSPSYTDVLIRNSGRHGIWSQYTSYTLTNARIENSTYDGAYLGGCGVATWRNVTVELVRGAWGVETDTTCAGFQLHQVTLKDLANRGWRNRLDMTHDVTLQNVTLKELHYYGADLSSNRTLPLQYAEDGTKYTSTIHGSFEVRNGAVWTVPANSTVYWGDQAYAHIGTCNQRASMLAEGTEAEPIWMGSASGSVTSGWYGLYFRGDCGAGGGSSFLRNVTLAYSRDDNIETYAYGSLTLDNVTSMRAGRWGFYFRASSPTLTNVEVWHPVREGVVSDGVSLSWNLGRINDTGATGYWTNGCGVATLRGVTIERVSAYGVYADNACAGAHLHDVVIRDVAGRAWLDRIDLAYENVVVENQTVDEVLYWGVDLTSNRTLPVVIDARDGKRADAALWSGFQVRNGAVLTIPAGTNFLMNDQSYIDVGTCNQRASLRAEGTVEEPIVMRSRSGSTSGGWYGLHFRGDCGQGGGESVLRNVTVSLSRDEGIDTYYYSGLQLDNVTVDRHARYGLYLRGVGIDAKALRVNHTASHGIYANSCGIHSFRDSVIERPGGYGFVTDGSCEGAHLRNVTFLDIPSRPFRNRIDVEVDAFVDNATIQEVEWWGVDISSNRTLGVIRDARTGAHLPNAMLSSFDVRNGAVWTVPANSTLLWGDSTSMQVGTCNQRASLRAEGTEAQPIVMRSRSGNTQNGWYGLHFRGDCGQGGGQSILRNVTISQSRDDGIDTYYYGGLFLDNVTLDRHARFGLYLRGTGIETMNTRVNDTASHGIYLSSCGIHTFRGGVVQRPGSYGMVSEGGCEGAHLYGTTFRDVPARAFRDRVDVDVVGVVVDNATVQEVEWWGVDLYQNETLPIVHDVRTGRHLANAMLSSFDIRGNAVWTIPANSTVLWNDGTYLNVGSCNARGHLRVDGTEANPVTFTSRAGTTTNGWYGLHFRGDCGAGQMDSVLRNMTISLSRDDGIDLYYYYGLTLDNVTFDRNARWGLWTRAGQTHVNNVVVLDAGAEGILMESGASNTVNNTRVVRSRNSGVYFQGCGQVVLRNVTVERPGSYGVYSDSSCNGFWSEGLTLLQTGNRPFRNVVTSSMTNTTIFGPTIAEVEFYGADIHSNRTMPRFVDGNASRTLPAAMLNGVGVYSNAWWTIEPGANLTWGDGTQLVVGTCNNRGNLLVNGTTELPVTLGSRSGSSTNGWYGVYLRSDCGALGTHTLRNATIRHSRDEGLDTYYAPVTLDNVSVVDNARHGLHLYGNAGTHLLQGVSVKRNGDIGLYAYNNRVNLTAANVSENRGNGMRVDSMFSTVVRDTMFWGNGNSGFNATSGSPALDVRRSYFWNNTGYGLDLQASTGSVVADNAFIENRAGQARATAANTWNVTRVEGRNIAYGPFLGGNSWSDYAGEDTDDDGLGDTLVPYATNLGPGRDWHPVMGNLYADFNVSIPDLANASRVLRFLDASRGGFSPADQWVWDFGDGGQAVTENATHEYAADGTYPVQLVVANAHGQYSTITKNVVVDSVVPGSVANLTGTPGLDGWFTSAVTVRLSATDDRAGVQTIFWRLDNGSFASYATPIVVSADGAHVVEHYAVDKNGNREPTRNVTFRLDRTAPYTAAANVTGPLGRAGWYVGNVGVSLAGGDNTSGLARIEWGYGNATPLTYNGTIGVVADGVTEIAWRPVDAAGNVGALRNVTVRRDALLPSIEGHETGLLGGAGWYLGPVNVTLTANDTHSGVAYLNASVDGGNWTQVNGTITLEGHGVHTIDANATDVAGNENLQPSRFVRIDLVSPVSNHTFTGTIGANGWYVSPINVSFTGADNGSGVSHFVYAIDGGENRTYVEPFEVAVNGQHLLTYYAVDAAGNAETRHEVVLFLDLAAPETRLRVNGTPGLNGWFLGNVTGEIVANDSSSVSQILYALDAGDEQQFLAPFPIAGEGVHNVSYYGVSLGGLVEQTKVDLVRIDLNEPTLAVELNGTQGLGGWWTSAVSATLVAQDSASGIATRFVQVDGGVETTYTGPVTLATTGNHTVAGRTLDVAGRAAELAAVSVKVDVSDPVASLSTLPAAPQGANGWFTTPVELTFGATDVGSGAAGVLVSIDGAPETLASGPVVLAEGVHTIAYRALDAAGRLEPLRNATIRVDLTPPTLNATLAGVQGLGGWYTSAVNATLAGSDATSGVASVHARIGNGPESAVTGPLTLATTGVHNITWRVVDAAGLSTNSTLTVRVDLAPPVATRSITGAASNGWRTVAPTVTLSATDVGSGAARILYVLDGAPAAEYTGPFVLGEGWHNLSFQAIDVAGLVQALTSPEAVNVDLTDPTGSVSLPAPTGPNGWAMSPITVTLNGADTPSGLRNVEWWIDNGGHTTTTAGSIVLGAQQEGAHVLRTMARDVAGRVQTPVLETPYKLDLNAPVTTAALGGTPGAVSGGVSWYRTPVNVSLTAVDVGAGVDSTTYRLGSGANATYTGPFQLAGEGVYDLSYFASDLVGRVESLKTRPPFGVDMTPPAVEVAIDGVNDSDGVYRTLVNVSLLASDPLSGVSTLQYRLGNGSFRAYAGPIFLDLSGAYRLEVRATDIAGNLGPVVVRDIVIEVDTTPPVTTATLTGPQGEPGWFRGPVTVRFNATDTESSIGAIQVALDGGAFQTLADGVDALTVEGEGTHTLQYFALDIANNVEPAKTVQFQIDLTPPTLALDESYTAGRAGWIVSWVNLTPLPSDAFAGVARVEAKVDNGSFAPVSRVTLSTSGQHTVVLRAIDRAGLASPNLTWTGRMDVDVPTLHVLLIGPQGLDGWFRQNVTIVLVNSSVDTSGVLPVQFRVDDAAFAPYTGPVSFDTEGNHTVEAFVEDVAGNVARLRPTNIGIDRTLPAISLTPSGMRGNAGWWTSPVLLETIVADMPGVAGANVSGLLNVSRTVDGVTTTGMPGPLTLSTSGVHTVLTSATDRALNTRATEAILPVDVDDPTLAVVLDGPTGLRGWFTGPVLVNVTSLDATSGPALAQRVTSEGPQDITGPILVEAEGVHGFALRAVDIAGRLGEETPLDVRIDGTPPELAAAADGPRGTNGWFTGPTRVRLDATDLVSGIHEIRYTVDDAPELVYNGTLNLTTAGRHVINYTGYDVAGNLLLRQYEVAIDMSPPVATLATDILPNNASWFRTGVNVTLNASDIGSGVAKIQYTFDLNASWIDYVGPIAVTAEGNHTLYYRAIDESGLPSLVYSHHILIDLTTPVVGVRLEHTLYTEVDGRVYVSSDFCVEVTGIDLLSGITSAVLRLTGSITKLVVIDLTVSLHCFELPEEEGWEVDIGVQFCDGAGWCGDGDLELEDGGGGGGGGPSMVFERPFGGGVNMQHVSVPVFRTAFQPGVKYDTGIDGQYPDPDDPLFGEPRDIDGNVTNPTMPQLAQATLVSGSRVPVWITASGISPKTVEFFVDGKKVNNSSTPELVRYERFYAEAMVDEEGVVEPSLERENRTMLLFVFQLDATNLTAGEHVLEAKGIDRKGRTATGRMPVLVVSPAVGNLTMTTLEEALADGDVPGPLPSAVPKPVRDAVPQDVTPDLPPEARARLENAMRAGRIVLDLLDDLVITNYAFIDSTVLRFYEAYEAESAALRDTTGQPDPVTIYDVGWHAQAPGPNAFLGEESP